MTGILVLYILQQGKDTYHHPISTEIKAYYFDAMLQDKFYDTPLYIAAVFGQLIQPSILSNISIAPPTSEICLTTLHWQPKQRVTEK